MNNINITFLKQPCNAENSFLKDSNAFVTSAAITMFNYGDTEIFNVKLNDIGLNSLYGKFEISRQNGNWKTTDIDSCELNSLKMDIISALSILPIPV